MSLQSPRSATTFFSVRGWIRFSWFRSRSSSIVSAFEWEMFLADAVVETHDRIVGRTYREAARTCDAQLGNETASVRGALRAFAELGTALIGAKDTGEALDAVIADVADLRLDTPAQVHLYGKGRKERVCPLWPQTADLLRALLVERGREPRSDEPVFRNHRGTRLTRFGVRYLLQKYCTRAQASVPALRAKRLHPHSMRHSTAVHLLRAGVDIVTMSLVSG